MTDKIENQEVFLELKKIYLKDVSFESPLAPGIFTAGQTKPEMDIQLAMQHALLDGDFHEVVLQVTASTKLEDKTMFLIEVHQAGVFEIKCAESQLEMIKEVACTNMLLPFVRETIADLAAKGGFPQLLLNPVNFEALYARKQQQAKKGNEAPVSDAIN